MTIWTMRIEYMSGCYLEELAAKECEIDATFTLKKLCEFILESFEFDNGHMHEFFIAKVMRHTNRPIHDESAMLQTIFPLEKNHFLFMRVDFGDDWIFRISRSRTQAQFSDTLSYPRIVDHIGKHPEQYPRYAENN